jgi:lipopolysaccharide transport system ATP-binding protein
MKDVGQQGRTVLFVSHSIATLQALCQRGIFMQQGQVKVDDTIERSIQAYLQTLEQSATCSVADRTDRQGRGQIRLKQIEIILPGDVPSPTLITGMPAHFVFHVNEVKPGLSCVFHIFDDRGMNISSFNSSIHGYEDVQDAEVGPRMLCKFDELLLPPGRYRLNVEVRTNQETQDHVAAAAFFDVVAGPLRGRAFRFEGPSFMCMPHAWTTPY